MKITIEIPDEKIRDEVFYLVTKTLAQRIFEERFDPFSRQYKSAVKDCVKEAIKGNIDDIVDRAIPYASDYIGKKGVKKFVEMIGEKME